MPGRIPGPFASAAGPTTALSSTRAALNSGPPPTPRAVNPPPRRQPRPAAVRWPAAATDDPQHRWGEGIREAENRMALRPTQPVAHQRSHPAHGRGSGSRTPPGTSYRRPRPDQARPCEGARTGTAWTTAPGSAERHPRRTPHLGDATWTHTTPRGGMPGAHHPSPAWHHGVDGWCAMSAGARSARSAGPGGRGESPGVSRRP